MSMNYKQQIAAISGIAGSLVMATSFFKSALFTVEPGNKGFKFNKVSGVRDVTLNEGLHFKLPYLEKPIIYNVKSQPKTIGSKTGSADLQEVSVALRVLFRPNPNKLQTIYRNLGKDYDERVLPSIVNEVLKGVVAKYDASALLIQRNTVSDMIKHGLETRLGEFNIILDDVSIVELAFGEEYKKAVESKQIAQQQAERAKFIVERAIQEKQQIIIKAKGEARAAELFGKAMHDNPAYIDLRRIDAARDIAKVLGQSQNRVYLDSDSLLLNLTSGLDQNLEKKQPGSGAAFTPFKSKEK